MTYLEQSDAELTLACWASNSVGRQEIPCLIHIIPASEYCYTVLLLGIFVIWTVYSTTHALLLSLSNIEVETVDEA